MGMMDQKHWKVGFAAGFADCEAKVRVALRGHQQSDLWGKRGLLAATMRSNDGYRDAINKAANILLRSVDPEQDALKILEETE
jgi:hypothetical protein